MASKQHDFKPGDVFFLVKGRIVFQGDCPRGEPPKETKSWSINGQPQRGWMDIATFGVQARNARAS